MKIYRCYETYPKLSLGGFSPEKRRLFKPNKTPNTAKNGGGGGATFTKGDTVTTHPEKLHLEFFFTRCVEIWDQVTALWKTDFFFKVH